MSRLFDNYVMVDWSAASKPTTGADSVWVGVLRRDVRLQLRFEHHNPSTRREAEGLIGKVLDDFAKRGDRTLLGFDFPLGFPAGFAASLKLGEPAWRSVIDLIANEIKDKPDNANNRFQVAAMFNRRITGDAFPFWGCPPRDELTTLKTKRPRPHGEGDLPELRHAERAAKSAQSVWKLYYNGSVGGQMLTGLPVVKRLRDARPSARLWPFETGWRALDRAALDGVEVVVAEIYPSLVKAKADPGEVKDLSQVRAVCEHFAALDEAGRLGAAFGPAKTTSEADISTVEREEGWILGV